MNASLKSPVQVDYYLGLLVQLLRDLQRKYPEDEKSLIRDEQTLKERVRHEGLEFMTKTLPKLGKALDRALETGFLEVPREFKRSLKNRAIPAFLQGMLRKCFPSDGFLVKSDADVIRDIRQVAYLVYKLEVPISREQSEEVINRFVQTEMELPGDVSELQRDDVTLEASKIIQYVLKGINLRDIVPRHGPGAVATGERMEQKWEFSRFYNQIHQTLPYYDYFVVGSRLGLIDRKKWYLSLPRIESGTAKVVLVPKDSRGPRLISCEPLEFQWVQQGVNKVLVRSIERHWLTRGQINFRDQTTNASLALESSRWGYYATIDLKDASDRLSLVLVEELFGVTHSRVLRAVRSTATKLPDGRVVSLRKHAPMGSAVCFSVEALCFWALCVAAICRSEGVSIGDVAEKDLRKSKFQLIARDVFVYGDDIVIPVGKYRHVVEALENAGLRVNVSKCYVEGDFRESCGVDAYCGHNVTPTKVSTLWTRSPGDGSALASYAAYANDLARKGYAGAAAYIRYHIAGTYGLLPYGTPGCGFPCVECPTHFEAVEANYLLGFECRWNRSYQRVETRVRTLKSKVIDSTLDSWARLMRDLTMGPGETPDQVTVPRRSKIAIRWMRP